MEEEIYKVRQTRSSLGGHTSDDVVTPVRSSRLPGDLRGNPSQILVSILHRLGSTAAEHANASQFVSAFRICGVRVRQMCRISGFRCHAAFKARLSLVCGSVTRSELNAVLVVKVKSDEDI